MCEGETPLTHAARQGHTSTAKYLIDHGANPSIPSELGTTALHYSAGIGKALIPLFGLKPMLQFALCLTQIIDQIPLCHNIHYNLAPAIFISQIL